MWSIHCKCDFFFFFTINISFPFVDVMQNKSFCTHDSPSMSSLCMMMASSTSLGMYPRDRMAIPSSCLEMNPFPSRSSTLNASRISANTNKKSTQNRWATLNPPASRLQGKKSFIYPSSASWDIFLFIFLHWSTSNRFDQISHSVRRAAISSLALVPHP